MKLGWPVISHKQSIKVRTKMNLFHKKTERKKRVKRNKTGLGHIALSV